MSSAITSAGDELGADAVVVGVGIRPAVELAEAAGLALDDGVAVDAGLRTCSGCLCRGDVAAVDHLLLGMRVRVEHWANA